MNTDVNPAKDVDVGKSTGVSAVNAAGDAEVEVVVAGSPVVETDPVGEVVLDVNVASEELELDDSLC